METATETARETRNAAGQMAGQVAGNGANQPGKGQEVEEITIKFAKGLVGDPFVSKKGAELVSVKIPNKDPNDHSPWASFVLGAKQIHEDGYGGKALWAKIPKDGYTTVRRSTSTFDEVEGKNVWTDQNTKVSNAELKEMVEFYKNRRDHSSESPVPVRKEVKPDKEELPFR